MRNIIDKIKVELSNYHTYLNTPILSWYDYIIVVCISMIVQRFIQF